MTPEQVVAILQLLADLRLQLGQTQQEVVRLAAENAELRQRVEASPPPA